MTIDVRRIDKGVMHFVYLLNTPARLTIELYSHLDYNHFEYSTTMDFEHGVEYWIGHWSLLSYEKIKICVKNSNGEVVEESILDLDKQKDHLINLIGFEDYHKIESYLNASYTEIFIDDVAGLNNVDEQLLRSCKNVIDLGSNAGFFGRYLSRYVKMDNYICVDPNSSLNNVNKIVNKNTANNHVIYNSAFYGEDGVEVDFYSSTNPQAWTCSTIDLKSKDKWDRTGNSTLDKRDIITTTSLRTIIEDSKLEVVDFLKVDIEGAEIYLLSSDNMEVLKSSVKHISVEYHSGELKNRFLEVFNKDGFRIESSRKGHFQIANTNLVDVSNPAGVFNKRVLMKVSCSPMGDTLCSTPTIRKVSQVYGHKVSIKTYHPNLFKNNPYVDDIYSFKDVVDESKFDEVFETYNQHIKTDLDNGEKDIELKLSNFEARQTHALGVGITLYPEEMSYDFVPDEQPEELRKINKDFLVFHVIQSWPNRTWSVEKWQRLTDLVKNNTDFKIVTVGRSHKEISHFGDMIKRTIPIRGIDMDYCVNDEELQYQDSQLLGKDTFSELWHIINNSFALVSFDAGPVHMAGATDTHIIQIGASLRPERTAPYRNGSQNYKYHYIRGQCNIACASEPSYSVKEWGTINSVHYLPACQEKYDEFRCHPTPDQVFFKICEIKEKENIG